MIFSFNSTPNPTKKHCPSLIQLPVYNKENPVVPTPVLEIINKRALQIRKVVQNAKQNEQLNHWRRNCTSCCFYSLSWASCECLLNNWLFTRTIFLLGWLQRNINVYEKLYSRLMKVYSEKVSWKFNNDCLRVKNLYKTILLVSFIVDKTYCNLHPKCSTTQVYCLIDCRTGFTAMISRFLPRQNP